jgi:hypothetical protein
MNPTTRAKFQVNRVETTLSTQYGNGVPVHSELKTIKMTPVCSGSEENKQFFKWTPSGTLELGVLNPAVAEQFKLGMEFYIDFTPATVGA